MCSSDLTYPGFVITKDIKADENDTYRYWLHIPFTNSRGRKTLCVISRNHSTGNRFESDQTLNRICKVAYFNGYGSVIIMNLFPYRAKDSKELPKFLEASSYKDGMKRNEEIIIKTCEGNDVVFAWGKVDLGGKVNQVYDTVIRDMIYSIKGNTYYVKKCSCKNHTCTRNHRNVRYPLNGLVWSNNSELIPYKN